MKTPKFNKTRNPFKRVVIDVLGYLMIISSGLLGWLPGPGGMPLLFGGLGLLSIHNKWAHDLIEYLKVNGLKLADKIFPDRKLIAFAWDIVFVGLLIAGSYAYAGYDGILPTLFGAGCLAVALYIVALNRKRLERLINKLKK